MNQKICNDIKNYIRFLEDMGYIIALTFVSESAKSAFTPLIQYDFHPLKVCNYLKRNPGTKGKCIKAKKIFSKKHIEKPYYSCCYAGVEEYIIPVKCEGELIVYIHVSGYRDQLSSSSRRMKLTAKLCDENFYEEYEQLSSKVPSFETVHAFTRPLYYMLVDFYRSSKGTSLQPNINNSLYLKALKMIYEDESSILKCKDLADKMNYSESYIRYIFKKDGNVSVQKKINEIRLEKAKRLLSASNAPVTQIAFLLGFNDSNYFSAYFKKHIGLSPLNYRKRLQHK